MLNVIRKFFDNRNRNAKKLALIALGASAALISLTAFMRHRKRNCKLQSNTNQSHKPKISALGEYKSLKFANFNEPVSLHYKDKEAFFAKLKKFKLQGPSNLQVVSDFDYTISSFKYNGKPVESLYGTFRNSDRISLDFKEKTSDLFKKYSPIEIDEKLDINEKRRLLAEWYQQVKENYLSENLDLGKSLTVLSEGNISLRFGFDQFMKQCAAINLPLYVVSGGISNLALTIFTSILDINKYPNLFVFSNDLIFDEKTKKLVDMKVNVDATTKSSILHKNRFTFRKNTLVFGDLITDSEMGANMGSEDQITIGFLDPERKYALNTYLDKFDLVILGDGNFLLHERILNYVLGEPFDADYERKLQVVDQGPYNEIIERIK